MASPPVRTVALLCHPESRSTAVRSIRADVTRDADGVLAVRYRVEGDIGRLRVPPPRPPGIVEGLWHHTCCEMFVATRGAGAYHELNFGPSGEWTAYAFAGYREGSLLADDGLDPRISVRITSEALALEARVQLDRLSPQYVGARLVLGLSVVIEDASGALSHWALRHPPSRPDFHHPDAFALALDEVRD